MVRLWWNDIQKDICYSPLHITPWYIRSRKMRPNYFHYASTLYLSFSIGLKRTSVVKLWNQTCKSKTAVNPQYTSFNQLLDEYWLTITGSNTTQSNKWRIWQTFWATLNVFNDVHRGQLALTFSPICACADFSCCSTWARRDIILLRRSLSDGTIKYQQLMVAFIHESPQNTKLRLQLLHRTIS